MAALSVEVQPSDVQLLEDYLRHRIETGKSPSPFFHTADVYELHPEELTRKYAAVTSGDGAIRWHFFTELREEAHRAARTRRLVGSCGFWHGEHGEKPVLAGVGGRKIGYRKSFTFCRKEKGRRVGLGWIMSEVGFGDGRQRRARIVIHKIYRSPRAAPAPAPDWREAAEGEGSLCATESLEEGEFVPGYADSVGSNHVDGKFVPEHDDSAGSDDEGGIVMDGGALPSPTPSGDCGSGGTISVFSCPVCRRDFKNKNGLGVHMSAHRRHERRQWNRERIPAISGGWAVAGNACGSVGRRSVFFPRSEGVVDSMSMVVPEPVINPMPIAFASSSSSSAERSPRNDDSMAIPVASLHNPTRQVVVHPSCSSQFLQGHQPAARQVVVAQAPPSVAQGRWVRKEKECDQRRSASKRQNTEAADWSHHLHLGVGETACAKRARLEPCNHCASVSSSVAQLSGHTREHYAGNATPQKPGARPKASTRQLASAPEARPAVAASPPPVVLRIFGVDIVVPPPGAAANGTSSVLTETDQSSAASSTGIEQ